VRRVLIEGGADRRGLGDDEHDRQDGCAHRGQQARVAR
jgi:hypothetical protein